MNGLLRDFILAAAGAVTSMLGWGLLNGFLWWPYWRELRATGWIYVDDVGVGYLMAFWPWILATIWFIGFLIWRQAERNGWNVLARFAIIITVLLPGLLSFGILHAYGFMTGRMVWHYPGLTIVILTVGVLLAVARRKIVGHSQSVRE